jgi:WhiB family redox-sensing transcriptional regulator
MNAYTGQVPDTDRGADWRDAAAYRGADDAMFPDSNTAGIAAAKTLCAICPSQPECLAWALDQRIEFGVWGGLSEAERRAILRRRAANVPEEPDPRPVNTFVSVWGNRHQPLDDGHIGWTGAVPVYIGGGYYTPQQISFRIDRGHAAFGVVKRTCERDGCVHPKHLRDQRERDAARQAAVRAAVAV